MRGEYEKAGTVLSEAQNRREEVIAGPPLCAAACTAPRHVSPWLPQAARQRAQRRLCPA